MKNLLFIILLSLAFQGCSRPVGANYDQQLARIEKNQENVLTSQEALRIAVEGYEKTLHDEVVKGQERLSATPPAASPVVAKKKSHKWHKKCSCKKMKKRGHRCRYANTNAKNAKAHLKK